MKYMKKGIELIAIERQEQIKKHGVSVKMDKKINKRGQLIRAVEVLTTNRKLTMNEIKSYKPFNWNESVWTKMCVKSYKKRLIISGALIAAEYDRLTS